MHARNLLIASCLVFILALCLMILTAVESTAQQLFLQQSRQSSVSNQTCLKTCLIDDGLINLISQFEGYNPFTYDDGAGNPTIGHGHLIKPGEHFDEPLLPEDAANLLQADVTPKAAAVNKFVQRPLRQGQFNALVSLTYNVGEGNLVRSILLKKVNENLDVQVPPEFLKWDTAGGRVLKGLYVRRHMEAHLYARDVSNL